MIFYLTRTKNHLKKSLQLWLSELFLKAVFFSLQKQLIYDFLARKNYHDSPHSQSGMKFATQISPLLNYNQVAKLSGKLERQNQICEISYQIFWAENPDFSKQNFQLHSSILVYHFCKHAQHFCSTWMTSQMQFETNEG